MAKGKHKAINLEKKRSKIRLEEEEEEEEVSIKPEKEPVIRNKRKLEDDEEIDFKSEEDEEEDTKRKNTKKSVKKRLKQQKTTEDKPKPKLKTKPIQKPRTVQKPRPKTKPISTSKTKTKLKPKQEISDDDSMDIDEKIDIKDEGSVNKKVVKKKSKPKVEDEEPEPSEGEEDEEFLWWKEESLGDGTAKWTTLAHNGVYFPPDYVPHNVMMKYNGREVKLEPEAEEVATFYAAMLNTNYVENDTFNANFFKDWLKVLKKSKNNSPIKEFEKCDFTPIYEYLQLEKERKKNLSKEEKQKLKEEKTRLDELYGYCFLDGRKEKVGNFRIEPPGLFRGRGDHPKTGSLKLRVYPEQITINISKDAVIPSPPAGHSWAGIVHENTVTWLATWKENVNQSIKYVFLAANSSLKGQSDMKKFDKARELKQHVAKIRRDYMIDLKDKQNSVRQRATAMYFIDHLALRAGNEKQDYEADTVGCCSLRYEHIKLIAPKTVEFDFLGKDSIRYVNSVEVIEQVFKNLRIFMKDKKHGDDLFDRLKTQDLNRHLSGYMKGLTAKVFRTYNASHTFQRELNKETKEAKTVTEKMIAYNKANRQVAIMCNHQRSVSKAHDNQINRIDDKVRALKYQRDKCKKALLDLEPKLLKKEPELFDPESDMEDDWIIDYEEQLMDRERSKIEKKFEKDNEKLMEEEKEPKPEEYLKQLFKEVDKKQKELEKERKSGVVKAKKGQTSEKLRVQIEKLTERIKTTNLLKQDKEDNKTTALGTSKINYLDPRISIAWCKKHEVPNAKIFNKSLREKFRWALDVDADWEF